MESDKKMERDKKWKESDKKWKGMAKHESKHLNSINNLAILF